MSGRSAFTTAMLVRLQEVTNHTFVLPLLIFYPTSRCNSRCISCDWWKQSGAGDLTLDEIEGVAASLPALGTRVVVFSGGEPLLRPEVFQAAAMFRAHGIRLHLLTSGVLLERCAESAAEHFARVIVSLDATTETLYQAVRGVAALGAVGKGVTRLRQIAPGLPVTARATLHRANFRELPRLIERARSMAFDGISFLAADTASTAFGRQRPPDVESLALDRREIAEFEALVEQTIEEHRGDFESGFVTDSPDKLRHLPQYYAALAGRAPFPPVACNAPWMSVVIEADGAVRPCFFHEAVGNVRRAPLRSILAGNLRAFRGALDISTDRVCRQCVCSIRTGWRSAPWRQ
jgi:MoaA/NifB/PqqE/SkfB family radical SAM enzyme